MIMPLLIFWGESNPKKEEPPILHVLRRLCSSCMSFGKCVCKWKFITSNRSEKWLFLFEVLFCRETKKETNPFAGAIGNRGLGRNRKGLPFHASFPAEHRTNPIQMLGTLL